MFISVGETITHREIGNKFYSSSDDAYPVLEPYLQVDRADTSQLVENVHVNGGGKEKDQFREGKDEGKSTVQSILASFLLIGASVRSQLFSIIM